MMKKLILIFLCLPMIGFGQNLEVFNAYKYIVVNQISYNGDIKDPYDLRSTLRNELNYYGFKALPINAEPPTDLKFNKCYALFCQISHGSPSAFTNRITLSFYDCNNNLLATLKGAEGLKATVGAELRTAIKKALRKFRRFTYTYNPKILDLGFPDVELTNETDSSLTAYFDSNILHDIEGIYKSTEEGGNSYTIGIKKYGRLFKAIIIEADYQHWKEGEVKIILNQTATKGVYSCSYYLSNKQKKELFLNVKFPGVLTFNLSDENKAQFVKMYPINTGVRNGGSNGEWSGNGSGFFISETGYIVTNYHVIEKASEIEVEFKYRNEIIGFNAKVIQTDAINDLAIIKIDDDKFSNTGTLPYTFRTRSVDVGTKIYTYGYPKALGVKSMGKEIKVTEGIISSKSAAGGDITKYQITAPIQPGNSGGPLFDDKGNLIGINSSRFNSDETENVNYAIKSSYLLPLIDGLPETISLPSSTQLASKPLTEQIKILSDYVVLIKVK